jgi:hypothetical protein
MTFTKSIVRIACLTSSVVACATGSNCLHAQGLTLEWDKNFLTISRADIPGGKIQIHYLEAYCRANSHETDWVKHTVVPHETKLVSASADGKQIRLQCRLSDGVVVDHTIRAGEDEVSFELRAHNPTDRRSEVHWAQPCIRVGAFTGLGPDTTADAYAYIRKCFVFLDGKLSLMPTRDWATKARYTPGQVWAAPGVASSDVNPRPLHPDTPSNGLIGCFGADDKLIMAVAFEPYQELFQGVIRCIHSDFRLGGLAPGETKLIRGKIYVVTNDVGSLMKRYQNDFPEQFTRQSSPERTNRSTR